MPSKSTVYITVVCVICLFFIFFAPQRSPSQRAGNARDAIHLEPPLYWISLLTDQACKKDISSGTKTKTIMMIKKKKKKGKKNTCAICAGGNGTHREQILLEQCKPMRLCNPRVQVQNHYIKRKKLKRWQHARPLALTCTANKSNSSRSLSNAAQGIIDVYLTWTT